MPLPLAFGVAAGLLPVAKTRVWKKPLLADPARSLIALLLLPHRSLPQVIFGKTMENFERIVDMGEKRWVAETGGGFASITIRWVRLSSLGGFKLYRW
jgi:hypothetical protein